MALLTSKEKQPLCLLCFEVLAAVHYQHFLYMVLAKSCLSPARWCKNMLKDMVSALDAVLQTNKSDSKNWGIRKVTVGGQELLLLTQPPASLGYTEEIQQTRPVPRCPANWMQGQLVCLGCLFCWDALRCKTLIHCKTLQQEGKKDKKKKRRKKKILDSSHSSFSTRHQWCLTFFFFRTA